MPQGSLETAPPFRFGEESDCSSHLPPRSLHFSSNLICLTWGIQEIAQKESAVILPHLQTERGWEGEAEEPRYMTQGHSEVIERRRSVE